MTADEGDKPPRLRQGPNALPPAHKVITAQGVFWAVLAAILASHVLGPILSEFWILLNSFLGIFVIPQS